MLCNSFEMLACKSEDFDRPAGYLQYLLTLHLEAAAEKAPCSLAWLQEM